MMKKSLTVLATTFLSLSMLAACNTQDRDVANNNNQTKVGYQPVRFNPYKQNENLTMDGRFITVIPGQEQYRIQRITPDYGMNQPIPNRNQDRNIEDRNINQSEVQQQQKAPTTQQKTPTQNNEVSGTFQSRVIQLTNQKRQENGLPPLKTDAKLSKVAQTKADDMTAKNYFSHTSPTYGSPFQMLKDFGVEYKTAAENIAQGQTSPEQVVNSWMNSTGHRQNILSKDVTHIGVGYSKGKHNWAQIFIGR